MGRPKGFEKTAVLVKAARVFWRKGFADTTLQDLEKATGVNKSGLYSEFKGKDELFVASLQHYLSTNGVYELLQRRPMGWANIRAMLRASGSGPGTRGCFGVNCLREAAILPAKARAALEARMGRVRAAIVDNLRAEGMADEAEARADLILSFNAGLKLELNFAKDDRALEEKADRFLALIGRV